MPQPLRLFGERIGENHFRFQFGEFGEALDEEEVNLLSALVPHCATAITFMAFECPRSELNACLHDLKAIAGAELEHTDTGHSLSRRLGLGTVSIFLRNVHADRVPELLKRIWEYSPIAWGEYDEKSPLETSWLRKTTLPDSSFLQKCRGLGVSFYHGNWLGLWCELGLEGQLESRIRTSVSTAGRDLISSSEPL